MRHHTPFITLKIISNMSQAIKLSFQKQLVETKLQTTLQQLKSLEAIDPTENNKYLAWIASEYLKGSFSLDDTKTKHLITNLLLSFESRT